MSILYHDARSKIHQIKKVNVRITIFAVEKQQVLQIVSVCLQP
jgi:hypothetical protein